MSLLNHRFIKLALFSVVLLVVCFQGSTFAADSICKGIKKSSCSGKSSCVWVEGYTKKDGAKVKGYCRLKGKSNGKAGNAKAADKKALSGKSTTKKLKDKKSGGKKNKDLKSTDKKSSAKKSTDKKSSGKKTTDKKSPKKPKKAKDKSS